MATKPGLYANIQMRKPGAAGAPTNKAFKQSAKTVKTK